MDIAFIALLYTFHELIEKALSLWNSIQIEVGEGGMSLLIDSNVGCFVVLKKVHESCAQILI